MFVTDWFSTVFDLDRDDSDPNLAWLSASLSFTASVPNALTVQLTSNHHGEDIPGVPENRQAPPPTLIVYQRKPERERPVRRGVTRGVTRGATRGASARSPSPSPASPSMSGPGPVIRSAVQHVVLPSTTMPATPAAMRASANEVEDEDLLPIHTLVDSYIMFPKSGGRAVRVLSEPTVFVAVSSSIWVPAFGILHDPEDGNCQCEFCI